MLALVLAVLALGLAAPAAAQDRVGETAYWQEPCVPHAFDRLPQHAFVRYEGLLARGFGRCAVWVRLLLAPAGPGAQTVLRIRPTFLDEIALHDPLQPQVLLAGDRHPPAAGQRGRVITFTVPGGTAPRHVWLRLSTTSTRLFDVQGLSPEAAQALDRRDDWIQGVFLALLVGSLLWAFVQWIHARERVLGVFAARQAVALAWVLLVMGYGPGLLGGLLAPPAIDQLTSVLVLAIVASSIWFDRTLLAGYQVPRWGLHLLLGLVALLPLELALLFTGHASLALHLNAGVTCLAGLLICGLYLAARKTAQPAARAALPPRWLVVLYLLTVASFLPAGGTQLGLWRGGVVALSGLYVHALLTSVAMLVLLNLRASLQARALRDLGAARDRAEQEQLHRQEQERLVGMLVHELKTPLAAVRMLLGDGRPSPRQFDGVRHALADMEGLLERCAQASQLEGGGLQPQWTRCDLWKALQDAAGRWREAGRVELALDPALQPPACVQADAQWLRIILGNLLDNACKYSPADSRVQVLLAPCADPGDTGGPPRPGFAIDVANLPGAAGRPDAAQLFGKYYRSAFARRTTGSGLGLYLVAGLAQRLHGRVTYEPAPEKVRFRLWMPA